MHNKTCYSQTQHPKKVITGFFNCYRLADVRERLWEFVTGLLQSQQADDYTGNDRINALEFYRHLEIFIEASWLLQQKQNKKKQ